MLIPLMLLSLGVSIKLREKLSVIRMGDDGSHSNVHRT
jgi:hypothetical protein